MSDFIRLKKGLDLPISGEASCTVSKVVDPGLVSIKPTDFRGLVPRLSVKEGDKVLAGTPLFTDKKNPEILFCSPVSGTVESVVRGDKRKLLEVRVKADGLNDAVHHEIPKFAALEKNDVTKLLMKAGLWPCIKQRPYGIIANPEDNPKAIFVSGFNTAPLGTDLEFALHEDIAAIQAGFDILCKFGVGVHFCIGSKDYAGGEFHRITGTINHQVDGPHPAGNVGVQINHISPVNKGEVVWTVDLMLVAAIGRFFLKGVYDVHRTIAVAGPAAVNPSYVKVPCGVSMQDLKEYFGQGDIRVISGDVLTGENVGPDGFLGFYHNMVSVIPEGNYYEMFGWVKPFRLHKFSLSRSYWSWLCPSRKYAMDTNLNGGVRAFFVNDVYSKVFPMDIYPVYLFKAILAGDIEKMEQLGIYEVVEEDVALCEYVDPSKIEIQKIVSDGIDLMLKEMA